MNPFKSYGLDHLSASQLTTFAADPSRWFAQKVLGHRSPSSAAMERGKAVEDGIVAALKGADMPAAIEAGHASYDRATRFAGIVGDIEAEREHIGPMIEQALPVLRKFGEPDFPETGQHKVSIPVRFGEAEDATIDIIGFLDLVFDDRVIDIKSTLRAPTEMSFAHRVGAAIYARTTNKPVQYLYVTPKKTVLLEDDDVTATQAAIRAMVQRMAAFLSLSPDPEILRAAVPVVTDGWSWRGEEDARRRYFGI